MSEETREVTNIEVIGVHPQGSRGALVTEFTCKQVVARVQLIQQVMQETMIDGTHYGTIPGCGKEKVLMKAGAEKLALVFRLCPKYVVKKESLGNGHINFDVDCLVYDINGVYLGAGVGSASTHETKYRYRNSGLKCPACGKEGTVIQGKKEYGGGWLCYAKKGGCGEKWKDGEPLIESQERGKVENPDPADQWNTAKKIAKKRAFVDAVLTVTAASDIFTQDLEEKFPEDAIIEPEQKNIEPEKTSKNEPDKKPTADAGKTSAPNAGKSPAGSNQAASDTKGQPDTKTPPAAKKGAGLSHAEIMKIINPDLMAAIDKVQDITHKEIEIFWHFYKGNQLEMLNWMVNAHQKGKPSVDIRKAINAAAPKKKDSTPAPDPAQETNRPEVTIEKGGPLVDPPAESAPGAAAPAADAAKIDNLIKQIEGLKECAPQAQAAAIIREKSEGKELKNCSLDTLKAIRAAIQDIM